MCEDTEWEKKRETERKTVRARERGLTPTTILFNGCERLAKARSQGHHRTLTLGAKTWAVELAPYASSGALGGRWMRSRADRTRMPWYQLPSLLTLAWTVVAQFWAPRIFLKRVIFFPFFFFAGWNENLNVRTSTVFRDQEVALGIETPSSTTTRTSLAGNFWIPWIEETQKLVSCYHLFLLFSLYFWSPYESTLGIFLYSSELKCL